MARTPVPVHAIFGHLLTPLGHLAVAIFGAGFSKKGITHGLVPFFHHIPPRLSISGVQLPDSGHGEQRKREKLPEIPSAT
jgi:hypothetical protein